MFGVCGTVCFLCVFVKCGVFYISTEVLQVLGVLCVLSCACGQCVELCFVFWLFVLYACLLYLGHVLC